MGDLINRQAAIDAVTDLYWMDERLLNFRKEIDIVFDRIKALPSVQIERKIGKWIPVDSYSAFGGDEVIWMANGNPIAFHYCSECRNQACAGEDGESLLTNFCYNCGADMRGDEDG